MRSRLSRFALLALVPVMFTPALVLAQAPPEAITKIIDEGSPDRSQVMKHLDELTNTIGPRLTGSERLTKAVEWAAAKFKSFGVPNVRLVPWGEVEVGFDRGPHSGWMSSADGDGVRTQLTFGTNAWTPGTNGPVTGMAMFGPKTAEDIPEWTRGAKGAWVLGAPKGVTGKALADACTAAGAAGIIRNGGDLIITSGNMRTKWNALPTLVQIDMLKSDHVAIVKRLEAGTPTELRFDIENHFKQGPVVVYDVIAEIPGTKHPEEMVIVGGHIDSWDGATGTTDNGTGTATTIEAARLLMKSGAKPERTIRFMLWSGEEEGLLGSRAYIEKHPDENAKISAVLVHDGGTNYVSGILATAAMKPIFDDIFAPLMTLDEKLPFKISQVAALPRGIGSDHDSYLGFGVPGFFWSQAGRANYTHTHHTQYDTYDAAIPEYQRHTSKVVAIGALAVANLPAMLPRDGLTGSAGTQVTRRFRLGVQFDADKETVIADVTEGSAAAKAGLLAGDRITKIGAIELKSGEDIRAALAGGEPKKTITFVRGSDTKTVEVDMTPAARSAGESRPAR